MPPKPDLVYPSLDDFVDESVNESVVEKPTVDFNEPKTIRKENKALTIEDWVSKSEEEDEPKSQSVKPNFTKIEFVKSKTNRKPVEKIRQDTYKSLEETKETRINRFNPTIYTLCIEQFWATAKAKNINGEVQIHAKVNEKKVIIFEVTIRRDLKFEDEGGVDCLSNEAIFEQLTLMGMVKHLDSGTKFFMYPRLERIISGRDTPLFLTMLVPAHEEELGEGLTMPSAPQHTHTIIQPSTSKPQKKQKPMKSKQKDTQEFMPPKPDLVYPSLDDFVDESVNESVVEKPTVDFNEPKTIRKENKALTIEDWVSKSEEEDEPKSQSVKPNFTKIEFVKSKTNRKPVEKIRQDTYKSLEETKETRINRLKPLEYLTIEPELYKRPENKPNVAGSGPTWLFDIDTLTKTMNYQPVTTGSQSNPSAGVQEQFDAGKAGEEIVPQYVLFLVWYSGSINPHNTERCCL
nr:hypothetical protein [Tanacetum cinerariifolium]